MDTKRTPEWLEELLLEQAEKDEHRLLEMNKIRADQALAAITVIEEQIAETEQIAQQEIELISAWKESETTKFQNKVNWLSFNLENFIRSTGDSTINLPHGVIKIRKSRDKVEIVDLVKFNVVAQRLGLLRHVDAKDEPDMNAIRGYIKTNNGKPPVGVILTPGQPTFSYSTMKKGATNEQIERTETESGRPTGSVHQTQAAA
jgi:hypothetical protein